MSQDIKTATLWIVITLGLAALIASAVYFYQQGPGGFAKSSAERKADACADASKIDTHWRLVTGSVPSPTTKWRIFSIKGTICHVVNRKIRTFSIDAKMLKKTGCTAGDHALYCRNSAQPERHPRYEAIMNP